LLPTRNAIFSESKLSFTSPLSAHPTRRERSTLIQANILLYPTYLSLIREEVTRYGGKETPRVPGDEPRTCPLSLEMKCARRGKDTLVLERDSTSDQRLMDQISLSLP
jgi:hypothetical protein